MAINSPRFIIILATGLLLCLIASASTFPAKQERVPTTFHLKTYVRRGDKSKDGLYVTIQEINAFNLAVVVQKDLSTAAKGKLNGTFAQLTVGGVDYQLAMPIPQEGEEWGPVSLYNTKLKHGTRGFSIDDLGLEWTNPQKHQEKFRHWRVCDWTIGKPQLFWDVGGYLANVPKRASVPSSCAIVDLLVTVHGQ